MKAAGGAFVSTEESTLQQKHEMGFLRVQVWQFDEKTYRKSRFASVNKLIRLPL